MPPPEFIGFFLFLELHRLMCYTCDLPQGSASLRQACDASPTGSLKDLFSTFFFPRSPRILSRVAVNRTHGSAQVAVHRRSW